MTQHDLISPLCRDYKTMDRKFSTFLMFNLLISVHKVIVLHPLRKQGIIPTSLSTGD